MPASNGRSDPAHYDAIIIGAGFSGLYQLHKLRDDLGLRVRVLDMADEVGGTWYWNRYPGARCDSESYTYSYSFSHELEQEWSWTERYPEHPEIRRYLNFVADKLDLKRDIQFGTRVTGASFDDCRQPLDDHHRSRRDALRAVSSSRRSAAFRPPTCRRSRASKVSRAAGTTPATGRMRASTFRGKRVGQIGTGSTGIQAAPVIAAQAKHLTVFQRTANYSVPARNAPLSEDEKREIQRDLRGNARQEARDHQRPSVLDIGHVGARRFAGGARTDSRCRPGSAAASASAPPSAMC